MTSVEMMHIYLFKLHVSILKLMKPEEELLDYVFHVLLFSYTFSC